MPRRTLQVTTPSDTEVAMSRVFDAPREHVYHALTDPTLVRQWMTGPEGWSMPLCEADLRPGGSYRYEWRHDDGRVMGVSGEFLEVEPPARYSMVEEFDEAWYPGRALGTVVLEDHGAETTVTMTMRYESPEARDIAHQSPMTDGVALGFDRAEKIAQALARDPLTS